MGSWDINFHLRKETINVFTYIMSSESQILSAEVDANISEETIFYTWKIS